MNALLTLLVVSPFLLAILLANVAERSSSVRILNYIYLLLLNGVLMLLGLSSMMVGMLRAQGGLAEFANVLESIDWTGAGATLFVGALVALILLIPAVRRGAARLFPINPDSIVHATALSMTATTIGGNLYQMSISSMLLTPEGLEQVQQAGGATYVDILVFPLLTLLIAALLGVGWLTRRDWPELVDRLGLTTPSLPQLGLAVGVTVLLLGLAVGTDNVWTMLDPTSHQQVGGVSSALLGNFTGVAGAFAIGITAAIGEEMFFRGAYQPRMGIPMTALLFASFHVQYFISPATLLVLVIGGVLGVLRQRTTLAVCILVHFLYNFTSVLLGS
ncbi:MAG: CPBP family intramembrane metalloprotease [Chloroflexi bacterium]|nr:CPBP family intramembrane metalloprotease [Chloroflexota bacterium]